MIKIFLAVFLFIGFSAAVNAQSEECCSKDKAKATVENKHCEVPETVTTGSSESVDVASAMPDEKEKKETKTETKKSDDDSALKDEKGCCSVDKKSTDTPAK